MSKILLAEDDLSTRQFLTGALEKNGHTLIACGNGLEAWAAFEAAPQSFDLLLTDIVMPGMDGVELANRVKAVRPGIKLMFLTGFAAMAEDSGDNAKIVSKPFHLGNLTREIEQILKD